MASEASIQLVIYRLARMCMLDAQRAGDREQRDAMLAIVVLQRRALREINVKSTSPHAYLRSHEPEIGWPRWRNA